MTRINVWLSSENHSRLLQLKAMLGSVNLDDAIAKIIQFAHGELVLRTERIVELDRLSQ